jgi:hypothetical protein
MMKKVFSIVSVLWNNFITFAWLEFFISTSDEMKVGRVLSFP